MAAEDKDSRTEDPTEKRIKDAFEEGTFARSQDIGVVFLLFAAFFIFLFYAGPISNQVADISAYIFGNLDKYRLTPEMVVGQSWTGFYLFFGMLAPIALATILASLLAGGLQSGFKPTPKALLWKLKKLNPITNFKSQYLSLNPLVRFGIDLLKFIVIFTVIVLSVIRTLDNEIFESPTDVPFILEYIYETVIFLMIFLIVALGVVAVLDYLYQRWRTKEDLKMTKQEVKDERKQQFGNPEVRKAQRRFMLSLLQRKMLGNIENADVVVVNPTHYAVALKYEQTTDDAPVVLAKGKNLFAQRIREVAKAYGVPIVENKPLAQMLHKYGQVDKPVPVQLYQAVAEVLAFVYRTHRYYFYRLRQRRKFA